MDSSSLSPSPDFDNAPPIALRNVIRSTYNSYYDYNFLSYHRLPPSYSSFVFSLSTNIVPNNVHEALGHTG